MKRTDESNEAVSKTGQRITRDSGLEETLEIIDPYLDHYQKHRLIGERFGEILERNRD